MAKTKISEYDATAANNTDIDSINIAEGMAPSNVNNAIREMMAHLKDMDAGTHALTSPQLSSVDINGGTIDGVTIGGASAGSGTFTAVSVDNITIDGTEIDLSSGTLTLDSAGDISLQAGSGGERLLISNSTGDIIVRTADRWIYSNGTSGGATIDAGIRFESSTPKLEFWVNDGERASVSTTGLVVGAAGGNSTAIIQGSSGAGSTNQPGSDLQLKGGAGGGTGGSNVRIFTAPGGSSGTSESAAVERVLVKSTGDVGIGTGGDFTYDDITGSGFGLAIGSSSASSAGIQIRTGTSGVGRIYFGDNSGSDAGRKRGSIEFDHSTDDLTIAAEDDLLLGAGEDVVMRGSTYSFENSEGNANYAVITSSGNVGIGTSSPTGIHSLAKVLELSGGDGGDLIIGNNASSNIGAGAHVGAIAFKNIDSSTGSVPHYAGIRCESADTSGNMDLRFYTGIGNLEADTPQAIINENGNVGIGATSPGEKLEIAGDSDPTLLIRTDTADQANSGKISFREASGGTTGADLRYDGAANNFIIDTSDVSNALVIKRTDGNVGLGTTSPSTKFDVVAGSGRAATFQTNNSGGVQDVVNIGNLANANYSAIRFWNQGPYTGTVIGSISCTTSSTAFNTSSDYRLKENVVDLTGATARLKQLKPKRFNFIVDPDTTVDGFLAHEAATVVPEAITGSKDEVDADGNAVMQGIDQSKLVPLLVKTIQELEARITALEGA